MRITKLCALFLALTFSASAFAADGAATFKSHCVICHGPDAMGKIGPKLKGTTLSADDIANLLSTGDQKRKAPHNKPINGLTPEEINAVAGYVKSLK